MHVALLSYGQILIIIKVIMNNPRTCSRISRKKMFIIKIKSINLTPKALLILPLYVLKIVDVALETKFNERQ